MVKTTDISSFTGSTIWLKNRRLEGVHLSSQHIHMSVFRLNLIIAADMNYTHFYDQNVSTCYRVDAHNDQNKGWESLVISGTNLTLEDLVQVARYRRPVKLSDEQSIKKRMEESINIIDDVVKASLPLYGVTSLFGGLANRVISKQSAEELQNNLVRAHKTGSGITMPLESIRAAMLLRANTHLIGASGIRRLWDERLIQFLCEGVTPLIPEFGSIGASGDLVPLSYIASAISGQDKTIRVDFHGEIISGPEALQRLTLTCEGFKPKEGLALLNGTSVMTASAALACYDLYTLMAATIHVHAMAVQALSGSNQPFHPFIQRVKGHKGQVRRCGELCRNQVLFVTIRCKFLSSKNELTTFSIIKVCLFVS